MTTSAGLAGSMLFFQAVRVHAAVLIVIDQPDLKVLNVAQAEGGIMRFLGNVDNGKHPRLLLKQLGAVVDPVHISVGDAVGDEAPFLPYGDAVPRCLICTVPHHRGFPHC